MRERFRRRFCNGFTLIELLVVIVILGILMAVALPTFLRQQNKAKDSKAQQYLTTAYKVAKGETAGNNGQYPAVASLVSAIAQSEPEFTVASAACATLSASDPPSKILVDPSSTPTSLLLCNHSDSGLVEKLNVPVNGSASFSSQTVGSSTYSTAVLADSPTGYWHLADSSGTTAVAATGGINGTYSGAYSLAAAGATSDGDKAVSLSGGHVDMGNNYHFTGAFTLEAWIYPTAYPSSYYDIVSDFSGLSNYAGYHLMIQSSGVIDCQTDDGVGGSWDATSAATVPLNSWTHVVCVVDASKKVSVYINGAQNGTQPTGTSFAAVATNNFWLGANSVFSGHAFAGTLDELAVYNSALSSARIAAHYAAR